MTAKRVLVIDDAATVRMYHRQILETAGLEVEEAANGYEGLEKALASHFDLVLVDVNMPKMDGYAFVREVRKSEELRAIPVIMISTEAEASDATRGYEAGANFYLIKPVRPEDLSINVRLMTGAR